MDMIISFLSWQTNHTVDTTDKRTLPIVYPEGQRRQGLAEGAWSVCCGAAALPTRINRQ
jgi:hypothetical protein